LESGPNFCIGDYASANGYSMSSDFPKGRTAFLVIHGIGEQNPFETLDAFAQGLIRIFKTQGINVKAKHSLAERKAASGSGWVESCVRLSSSDTDGYIDVHEYYWAYMTEAQITVSEVMQWLKKTLHGAKASFREYKVQFGLSKKGWRNYWWRLNSMIWRLRVFYWIVRLFMFVINLLSYIVPWAKWIKVGAEKVGKFATPVIVGYVGDIAIYTTTDQKSKHYRLRQQIIAEASALLESLLLEKNGTVEKYDRVIIAGHSLGSVIAYDTLNRLNVMLSLAKSKRLPTKKVKGLITFGSPLDKIVFFFREHVGEDQYIRRQIVDQLHSFRSQWIKLVQAKRYEVELENPIKDRFSGLPWVNFFDNHDPISGKLEFYTVNENIPLTLPDTWPDQQGISTRARWGVAHVKYWNDPRFFNDIVERFLVLHQH